jgi:hypothetical protein
MGENAFHHYGQTGRAQKSSLRIAVLSIVPMTAAFLGASIDERLHLGFTTWRASCRAAGFRFGSVIDFTLQLLPFAVIGLLLGGLALIAHGLLHSRHSRSADCLAAHAGCALSLPVSLALCAAPVPVPLMLMLDTALAILAAILLLRIASPPAAIHP